MSGTKGGSGLDPTTVVVFVLFIVLVLAGFYGTLLVLTALRGA